MCFGASSMVAFQYHSCVPLGFLEKALGGLPIRSWGALLVGLEVLPRGVSVVLLRYLGVSSHNPFGVLGCLPGRNVSFVRHWLRPSACMLTRYDRLL